MKSYKIITNTKDYIIPEKDIFINQQTKCLELAHMHDSEGKHLAIPLSAVVALEVVQELELTS